CVKPVHPGDRLLGEKDSVVAKQHPTPPRAIRDSGHRLLLSVQSSSHNQGSRSSSHLATFLATSRRFKGCVPLSGCLPGDGRCPYSSALPNALLRVARSQAQSWAAFTARERVRILCGRTTHPWQQRGLKKLLDLAPDAVTQEHHPPQIP